MRARLSLAASRSHAAWLTKDIVWTLPVLNQCRQPFSSISIRNPCGNSGRSPSSGLLQDRAWFARRAAAARERALPRALAISFADPTAVIATRAKPHGWPLGNLTFQNGFRFQIKRPLRHLQIADHQSCVQALPIGAIKDYPTEPRIEPDSNRGVEVEPRKPSLTRLILDRSNQYSACTL